MSRCAKLSHKRRTSSRGTAFMWRGPLSVSSFSHTSRPEGNALSYDGMRWVPQPLPSGTRPRLVLINLCSEAVRTQSPNVDIGGSVREFLRRLSIDAGGESMRQFRKQMLALSGHRSEITHQRGRRLAF